MRSLSNISVLPNVRCQMILIFLLLDDNAYRQPQKAIGDGKIAPQPITNIYKPST